MPHPKYASRRTAYLYIKIIIYTTYKGIIFIIDKLQNFIHKYCQVFLKQV